MSKSNLSLPYPVLGLEGDFLFGDFSLSPNIYTTEENLIIDIGDTLKITNPYILQLFDNEIVDLVTKVNCSSTLFSKTFVGNNFISIDLNLIAKSIEIEIFLIANKIIDNYSDDSFNEEFFLGENNGVFNVLKGQLIGILDGITLPLSEEYLSGAKGIFKFFRRDNLPIEFSSDQKCIEIFYPSKENEPDLINVLSKKSKMVFVNLFILPALNYAFSLIAKEFIDENIDEYVLENDWAFNLTEEFPDYKNYLEQPYVSAQLFVNKMFKNKGKEDLPIFYVYNELK
jgi:hypothetical protein